jgi:hypothetical protein
MFMAMLCAKGANFDRQSENKSNYRDPDDGVTGRREAIGGEMRRINGL